MEYIEVPYTTHIADTLAALNKPGALLVAQGKDGYLNAMTIGWGTIGTIWGKPIFTVMVRPSRFTYRLMEEGSDFTVCVPSDEMRPVADFCGSKSGRSHDKFAELKLEKLPSLHILVPGIVGSSVVYECRSVQATDIQPDRLAADIRQTCYPKGDFHRVYYGEILAVRALQA
jgi:flavin reductase (DIM6/NTAB) family NADH-FMN oxidoreductase RutF